MITVDGEKRIFKLDSGESSYIMMVNDRDFLVHGYWGRRLPEGEYSYLSETWGHSSFEACEDEENCWTSPNVMHMEFPVTGRWDVKKTAMEIRQEDGSNYLDLRYHSYVLHEGKPGLPGLPATYTNAAGEAQTLEIILRDALSGAEVSLFYTAWRDLSVISRWAVVKNIGSREFCLERIMSANVDLGDRDFVMTTNFGAWASERRIEKHRLFSGVQGIYSRRGSSSHMHNPFLILQRPVSDEYSGEVYGAALAYSGSYEALVDVDSYNMPRMLLGINPDGFRWKMEPGASFTTPEADLVFSARGLGGMSADFHRLYRDHMCRGKYRNARRPVLLNTWEGCYFDLNEEKLVQMAKEAASLGIELLVVDDGWFGERHNDGSSLGDWYPCASKLPHGLAGLAKGVREAGCALGIWFEPEMISKNSALYQKHPEWVLCAEGRPIAQGRNQYVLDLSRQDVQDYLYDCIAGTIREGQISYIKWDLNRNFAEVGSRLLPPDRQGEVSHRYVLGLYALMERLVQAFPEVLFESCSGGGGRFDAGMLYYMPQIWTSDDTDALMRTKIQYGTSLVYPLSCMSAHISVCPNHQTWRSLSYKTRQDVAYTGSFGFELDPLKLTEEQKAEMAATIRDYKSFGDLFVNGTYYRMANLNDDAYAAWMFLAADGSEIFAVYVQPDVNLEGSIRKLRLAGLEEDAVYSDPNSGRRYTGAALMYDGLPVNEYVGDRSTFRWRLRRES